MGWWIAGPDGRIDFDRSKKRKNKGCVLSPKERDQEVINGDGPVDVMGEAIREIAKLYKEEWDRPPKYVELKAVFDFVIGPYREGTRTTNCLLQSCD